MKHTLRHRCVAVGLALAATLNTARVFAGEELVTETNEAFNFTVSYGKSWHKTPPPNKVTKLALDQAAPEQIILVCAVETDVGAESQIELLANAGHEIITRSDGRVADENTRIVKTKMKALPGYIWYINVFSHQGITYSIFGTAAEDTVAFTVDYLAFLRRFKFIGDRKEWCQKNVGAPQALALLGGLASVELNAPRWQEDALKDNDRDYTCIEQAHFTLSNGGSWLTIKALFTERTAQAELEELHHKLGQMFSDVTLVPALQRRPFPTGAMGCSYGGYRRLVRTAATVEDGIALTVSLECLDSKRDETEKDWNQVLRTLTLRKQSDPKALPAYALVKPDDDEGAHCTKALESILAVSQRIYTGVNEQTVLAIASDGETALISEGQALRLENLRTRIQTPLKAHVTRDVVARFSPDGNKVAWIAGREIHVLSLTDNAEQLLKIEACGFCFAGADDLLVCVPVAPRPANQYGIDTRFNTSRLERVHLADQTRTVLISFPFSKTEKAVISADQGRIALTCNRDDPRTEATHLYVCKADGTDLKQLTRGAEHFTPLAWSGDGQTVYAIGGVGKHFAPYGYAYNNDVYQVPLDGGKPINLTKCSAISRAWSAGDELFLELNYLAPASTRGIYRISGEKLAEATRLQPWRALDVSELMARVSEKVTETLGRKKLDDLELTPKVLRAAAQAFAETAGELTGQTFDFSAASLDPLNDLIRNLYHEKARERAFFLGAGAYYGETLRRAAGAEWRISPVPFGQWLPSLGAEGNALVRLELPFSAIYGCAAGFEGAYLESSASLKKRTADQKIILVYPPPAAAAMLREASDSDYLKVFKLLDGGEVGKAAELLSKVLERYPRNHALAQEMISICEAAGLPERAQSLARRALENGSDAPDLLVRYGDALAGSDPAQARQYYRRATETRPGSAGAFIKLGKLYAAENRADIARSCWRRGYYFADNRQRAEIRKLVSPGAQEPAAAGPPEDDVEE